MLMGKKLKLGQPGTERLFTQYVAHLVCVRCRYDAGHCNRFKTIEPKNVSYRSRVISLHSYFQIRRKPVKVYGISSHTRRVFMRLASTISPMRYRYKNQFANSAGACD